MEVPPNPTPDPVLTVYDSVVGILSTYGWTLLFVIVVLNLLWSHIAPKYREWRQRVEDFKRDAETSRDPSYVIEREAARQRAVQKLLEKHEKLTQEHEVKMKEKEEKKRRERLELLESMVHGKPKSSNTSAADGFRPSYNPLTGTGGGSCNFRPSRRLGGSGGGG